MEFLDECNLSTGIHYDVNKAYIQTLKLVGNGQIIIAIKVDVLNISNVCLPPYGICMYHA